MLCGVWCARQSSISRSRALRAANQRDKRAEVFAPAAPKQAAKRVLLSDERFKRVRGGLRRDVTGQGRREWLSGSPSWSVPCSRFPPASAHGPRSRPATASIRVADAATAACRPRGSRVPPTSASCPCWTCGGGWRTAPTGRGRVSWRAARCGSRRAATTATASS